MMQQSRIVKPGDPAKNFSLKDQNDTSFDLYENMHKRVLLSFHPLAWTAFCAGQMKSLEDTVKFYQHSTLSRLASVLIPYLVKKRGLRPSALPTPPCCAISGLKGGWLSSTGFSGRQTVFQKGQTSSSMKSRTWFLSGFIRFILCRIFRK